MKFTDEQKKAIVARYENGGSIRLICSEFNIPRSTLYRWFKTYKVDIMLTAHHSLRGKSIKCKIAL